jgi:hypothetical protein
MNFLNRKRMDEQGGGGPCGLYPYSFFRRFWEYLMYFGSLLVFWELPFEWAFDFHFTFVWIVSSLCVDVLFLIDVIIVQRTGVLHFGVVDLRQEIILQDIPRWRLIVFWLCPCPFYLIGFAADSVLASRILRCLKFLRITRLIEANRTIRNTLVYQSTVSSVGLLAVDLLTIIHVFSCIFWYVAQHEALTSSWLVFDDVREPQGIQYLNAMYYVTTTVLTVGYGDIHPISFVEICLVIVMELIGVFFYSFVCSLMISIIASPLKNTFASRNERLYSALKWRGVSDETLRELVRYQEYAWERARDRDDLTESCSKMPESLQRRVAMALHLELFQRIEQFSDCNLGLLERVALALKPRIFTPGDFLIKAGRVSGKMFIVVEGRIDLLSTTGALVARISGDSAGTVIGQTSVIRNQPEVVSVVAQTYLEAFELQKEDAESIELAKHYRFIRSDADPPGDLEEFSDASDPS